MSSDGRPPAARRGPDTVLPGGFRAAVVGLAGGGRVVILLLCGGALVPLTVVDLVRAGARGFVRGFGTTGPDFARFVAVLDGCSGLFGRLAPLPPIAGSFRG